MGFDDGNKVGKDGSDCDGGCLRGGLCPSKASFVENVADFLLGKGRIENRECSRHEGNLGDPHIALGGCELNALNSLVVPKSVANGIGQCIGFACRINNRTIPGDGDGGEILMLIQKLLLLSDGGFQKRIDKKELKTEQKRRWY